MFSYRKRFLKLLFSLYFMLSFECFAQEVSSGYSALDIMLIEKKVLLDVNSGFLLEGNKWTDLDRMFMTERYIKSMDFILLNNRTDLLQNLQQLSGYYLYLNSHPEIIKRKIKWPYAANAVTSTVMPIWEYGTDAISLFAGILGVLGSNYNFQDNDVYYELLKMYNEGISDNGKLFLDGTVSKKVAADVTKFYFNPLVKGEFNFIDAFSFDAEVLYREQVVILEPIYSSFTDVDKAFIINGLIKVALQEYSSTFNSKIVIDLLNPYDRVFIGLKLLGYDEERILYFLNKKRY